MAGLAVPGRPPGAADLDLGAIRAFVAVVEHRHFGKAAQALSVAVSTVTKRVIRLESSLGTTLLERDSGGVIDLTAAGRRFLPFASDLLNSANTARTAARRRNRLTLRIAVPAGAHVAAPLMAAELSVLEAALAMAHPAVGLTLSPTRFESINTDLAAGMIDVALMVGEPADPRLTATSLGDVHRVGLVGPTHPYALRPAVDVREFADQPILQVIGLPDQYMAPFLLADVRPLDRARLVPVAAGHAAQIVYRLMKGSEVTVVPAALTANLPPGLARVILTGAPACSFTAVRRRADTRPEMLVLIEMLAGFMDAIGRAAAR